MPQVKLANGAIGEIRIGVYKNNPTNQRLNRVGKKYKKFVIVKGASSKYMEGIRSDRRHRR